MNLAIYYKVYNKNNKPTQVFIFILGNDGQKGGINMWTPNRELKEEFKEEVRVVDFSVKDMLMYEINNTTIDYNRGFNKLWDMGWNDSKDKGYYMLRKPINKPTFINVSFILELIILKNNNWVIDKINVYPAIGGYCGSKNVEIELAYTSKELWDKSMKELTQVARELGYEEVKNCPISFTQEVLFRKIGTWNKPYIMRKRRSVYFKKKWGYLNKERIKSLVDCYKSRKFKETPYLRKKNEIAREKWYSKHLSEKMPKDKIHKLNYWFDVLKKYEWIWNFQSDEDEEDTIQADRKVQEFMKKSKLGLRTLYKNVDRLFPDYPNGCQSVENMLLRYNVAWKMYDRIASSWCRDYNGNYSYIMGIGPDHPNNQGNYYL